MFKLEKNLETIILEGKILKSKDYQAILKSQDLLVKASKDAEERIEQATKFFKDEGKRGYNEAVEKVKKDQAIDIYKRSLLGMEYIKSLESQLIDVVIECVEAVIGTVDSDEVLLKIAKKNMNILKAEKQVILKVAPSQVKFLRNNIADLKKLAPDLDFLEIKGDSNIQAPDCILSSKMGVVDASIQIQLDALKETLKEAII